MRVRVQEGSRRPYAPPDERASTDADDPPHQRLTCWRGRWTDRRLESLLNEPGDGAAVPIGKVREKDGDVIPAAMGVGDQRFDPNDDRGATDHGAVGAIGKLELQMQLGHRSDEAIEGAVRARGAEIVRLGEQFRAILGDRHRDPLSRPRAPAPFVAHQTDISRAAMRANVRLTRADACARRTVPLALHN